MDKYNKVNRSYSWDNDFFTPQEHILIGSTIEPGRCTKDRFYTPLCVQEGLAIEVANAVRQRQSKFDSLSAFWKQPAKHGYHVPTILEPLDEQGRTIRDPQSREGFKLRDLEKLRLRK